MQKIITRRNIIKITASAIGMIPYSSFASKTIYNYNWKGSALGNPVEMQIYTKNQNHLEKILGIIIPEINRLDKIFYLQDASSTINLLNKKKIILNPEPEILDAINLSEKFFNISKGSFDITVQPLWNAYSSGKKVVLDGIGFNNIDISKNEIRLLNKNTEITLNALAQGILTDRIHEILLNSGITNHLINFGEGRSSGLAPHQKKWLLNINNNTIDFTSYDSIQCGWYTSSGSSYQNNGVRCIYVNDPQEIKSNTISQDQYYSGNAIEIYQNNNYGSIALDLLISYSWDKLDLLSLYANINPKNNFSVSLFNKFYFKKIKDTLYKLDK